MVVKNVIKSLPEFSVLSKNSAYCAYRSGMIRIKLDMLSGSRCRTCTEKFAVGFLAFISNSTILV